MACRLSMRTPWTEVGALASPATSWTESHGHGTSSREWQKVLRLPSMALEAAWGARVEDIEAETRGTSGSVEKVRQLLARGADKDTRDTGGRTSLMLAAQHGCTDIVLALVDGGADKALMDQLGRTALRHARLGKHELLVEFLANGASDA